MTRGGGNEQFFPQVDLMILVVQQVKNLKQLRVSWWTSSQLMELKDKLMDVKANWCNPNTRELKIGWWGLKVSPWGSE